MRETHNHHRHRERVALYHPTGPMYFVFCRLYPIFANHHDSVSGLTVNAGAVFLIIWWQRFRGTQNEDDSGPLSIQTSLISQSSLVSPSSCAYWTSSDPVGFLGQGKIMGNTREERALDMIDRCLVRRGEGRNNQRGCKSNVSKNYALCNCMH